MSDQTRKTRTRRRIMDAAGRRMKSDGIDNSGVATLMKDAELTNGAFYAHFASKNELIAATVADQLTSQRTAIETYGNGADALAAFARDYLSVASRDDRAEGCPSAALLSEITHADPLVRRSYTTGIADIVETVAAAPGRDTAEAPATPRSRIPLRGGSRQAARAVDDPALSQEILDVGTATALRLLREGSGASTDD